LICSVFQKQLAGLGKAESPPDRDAKDGGDGVDSFKKLQPVVDRNAPVKGSMLGYRVVAGDFVKQRKNLVASARERS